MRSLKKEELVPLKDCLSQLLDFIYELEVSEVPYFHKFLERMKDNLEICILVHYEDWETIGPVLHRDWKEANHCLMGIPEFRACEQALKKEWELEFRFIELSAQIEQYFISGE